MQTKLLSDYFDNYLDYKVKILSVLIPYLSLNLLLKISPGCPKLTITGITNEMVESGPIMAYDFCVAAVGDLFLKSSCEAAMFKCKINFNTKLNNANRKLHNVTCCFLLFRIYKNLISAIF